MPLSQEDLRRFKSALVALSHEIRTALAQEEATKDSIAPDKAIGRLTRMEALQAQEMTSEGRRRQAARLQGIDRALEAIEQGTYGRCVACGEEIPQGRLEIMPETRLCVRCAARRR